MKFTYANFYIPKFTYAILQKCPTGGKMSKKTVEDSWENGGAPQNFFKI